MIKTFFKEINENPFDINEDIKEPRNKLFPCAAISTYSFALQRIYEELVDLIFLFDYLLDKSTSQQNYEVKDIKEDIINWVFDKKLNGETNGCKSKFCEGWNKLFTEKNQQIDTSRHLAIDHMLLNLCNPKKFSRISTLNNKQKIVNALYRDTQGMR